MWCVQAGTAVSSRVRREAPNSVNLVEFGRDSDDRSCRVERWDYQQSGGNAQSETNIGQFVLAHTSVLDLQRI